MHEDALVRLSARPGQSVDHLLAPLSLFPTISLCRSSEVVQQLYTLLLQLYGFEREAARLVPIRQAMAELAAACGRPAFDDLAELYSPQVMEAACSTTDT
jgi:hypothetical protein